MEDNNDIKQVATATAFQPITLMEEMSGVGARWLFLGKGEPGPQLRLIMARYDISVIAATLFASVFLSMMEGRGEDTIPQLAARQGIRGPHFKKLLEEGYFILSKRKLLAAPACRVHSPPLPCRIPPQIFHHLIEEGIKGNHDIMDPRDVYSVLELADTVWSQLVNGEIEHSHFYAEWQELIGRIDTENKLKDILNGLSNAEQVMLTVAACTHIKSRTGYDLHEFTAYLFDSLKERGRFLQAVADNELGIIRRRMISFDGQSDDPFTQSPDFMLSPETAIKIFGAQKNKSVRKIVSSILAHKPWRKATSAELFFTDHLKKEFDTVARTLSCAPGGRRAFTRRLKERGLPQGFTALFHGGPGTGKTASVHYLSRLVKRDILQVDLSQIRDMWVGNSEKNSKKIFSEYRRACEQLPVVPILLLNEADGLLSRRIETHTSVDAMNHTMQNILLEELEKFNGILFATTNLTVNMDDAFSRRFLYKLEFPLPTPDIRARIWHAKLPELSEEEASALAAFDLSGGEIENVTRRYIVDTLFNGNPDLARLETLCRQESSLKKKEIKMGFNNTGATEDRP
ncbi:MAG TPA: ATP-binding protein [bacterium]|nr:ATP-binding protein [bacterium]